MYLEVRDLKKSYGENGSYVQVLKGINTEVEKGQMCVIQGTSGSLDHTIKLHRRTGYCRIRFHYGGRNRDRRNEAGYVVRIQKRSAWFYLPVLQSGSESDRKGKYPGLRISDRTSAGYQ